MRRAAMLLAAGALLLVAAADPDPKTATSHVVKPGETLGGIAARAEVPRVLIIEANGLKAPYAVKAGQKLVIPRRRTHAVKDGDSTFSIAMDYGVPWAGIAAANGLDPKAALKPGQKLAIPTLVKGVPASQAKAAAAAVPAKAGAAKLAAVKPGAVKPAAAPSLDIDDADPPVAFAWPVAGKVRRSFAERGGAASFHDGIDIQAAKGTAIRASGPGTVIFAGEGPKEYGKTVILHHGQRWTTVYSYLDRITVKLGDKVKGGERLGLNGQDGLATEPQLHFEVRHNRGALNPQRYLPKPKS